MNLAAYATAALAVGGLYQLDQAARMILVEVGPGPAHGGVTLDDEAAGVARVLFNRSRAWSMLPSAVLRVRPGDGSGRPVWTMRLDRYEAAMAARGPGRPGYWWALARAAGAAAGTEGLAVGRRKTFVHLGNDWFKDHPIPEWSRVNPIMIGRTTFAGTP